MSKTFIPLARPDIQEHDIATATEVLRSGMLVQGVKVDALEKNMAAFLKVKNAAALSNGTATLHTALVNFGIGPGDEVIVPAFSYVATANVVELVGATPVFCDIEERTFNIDVDKISKLISKKTRAIIPVHEFGLSCDMKKLMKMKAEKWKRPVFVLEDAACALGATQNGKFAGTYGDYGSFSFHPRKAISSGEGGLLVSNDKGMIDRVKILRNHGIDGSKGTMDFVEAGFNYRMTDFQAALLDSQLSRLNKIIAYKQKLAEVYFNEIKNPKIILPHVPKGHQHTWQTFHVMLRDMSRDDVIKKLRGKNIGTNYGAQCIPAQTYYANKYKLKYKKLYPNAWTAYTTGLAIPIYERLSIKDIKYIAKTLNQL